MRRSEMPKRHNAFQEAFIFLFLLNSGLRVSREEGTSGCKITQPHSCNRNSSKLGWFNAREVLSWMGG